MDDRRFQIKIDGPAVEKCQISFSMLSRLLKGIQETVYSIALAGIQYDYRQRIRVPGEVKKACELYRVTEETGSYSLTAEIAQAQAVSGIEDIGLYAKNKYLEVVTILKDDQNWNQLNDLIPDSSYRRKILRSISSSMLSQALKKSFRSMDRYNWITGEFLKKLSMFLKLRGWI